VTVVLLINVPNPNVVGAIEELNVVEPAVFESALKVKVPKVL
jgi:hypothetical protein